MPNVRRSIVSLLIFCAWIGGAATYVLPIMQVYSPSLGRLEWSVSDIVKGLPQPQWESQRSRKSVIEIDFMELLNVITPRDARTGQAKKMSPAFIAGILVPPALCLAYLLLFIGFLLTLASRSALLTIITAAGLVSSIYALLGTHFLGISAQRAFEEAADQAGQGILGLITRQFVQQITIDAGAALYGLVAAFSLVLIVNLGRRT